MNLLPFIVLFSGVLLVIRIIDREWRYGGENANNLSYITQLIFDRISRMWRSDITPRLLGANEPINQQSLTASTVNSAIESLCITSLRYIILNYHGVISFVVGIPNS